MITTRQVQVGYRWAIRILVIMSLLGPFGCSTFFSQAESPKTTFTFESLLTLDEMSSLIQVKFPLGTPRANLRQAFVEEGGATLKVRTTDPSVEKYIYDIDLCHYYVWRWNISADYDAAGKLRQVYVNGNIVFPSGNPKKMISKVAEEGKTPSIYQMQRPRPEAYKGESILLFLLFDRDSDLRTTDDQTLIGGGPSQADPTNMGNLIGYTEVDPWRSIFDFDAADRIVSFHGDCNEVEGARKR